MLQKKKAHTAPLINYFTETLVLCQMLPVTLRTSACVWFSSILFIAIKNLIPLFFRNNTPRQTNKTNKKRRESGKKLLESGSTIQFNF